MKPGEDGVRNESGMDGKAEFEQVCTEEVELTDMDGNSELEVE